MKPFLASFCGAVLIAGLLFFAGCSDDTAAAPVNIMLFSTTNQYDGNLGGRAGADAKCAADNKPAGRKTVHAFISVSAADCISNMPATYGFPANVPVVAPDGTVIADNWADLLDGSIDVTLNDAGVLLGNKGTPWWSGSTTAGYLNTYNCSGWTTTNGSGYFGIPDRVDSFWIEISYMPGSSTAHLLGIAY